jgi:hypothetical protein
MVTTGDEKKLRFTIDALRQPDPFVRETSLTQEVVNAIKWQAARTPLQVMGERERIMGELEAEANNCWHVLLPCVLFRWSPVAPLRAQVQWRMWPLVGHRSRTYKESGC